MLGGSLNFDRMDATFNVSPFETSQYPEIYRTWFIRLVDHIIYSNQAPTVDEFRVCFDLDESNGGDINRWVKFAMEKRVSRFELDFSECSGMYYRFDYCYQFPFNLLDNPNNLLGSFGNLTSLRLIGVDLSDDALAYFISNCRSLEHLSIASANLLTYLNVTNASKLKHLEIQCCFGLRNVDISNTNIESLLFGGTCETQPSLEKLHLLSKVSLHSDWCDLVSQLQMLELDMGDHFRFGVIKFPQRFPTFCNLKHLKVSLVVGHDQDIFCLTSLVYASPLLNSFTLKVHYVKHTGERHFYSNCDWRGEKDCVHECLKTVKFIGWYGYISDMDIVTYLMAYTVLEKVIIDLNIGYRSTGEDIVELSRNNAKSLEKYVRPGIDLIILQQLVQLRRPTLSSISF